MEAVARHQRFQELATATAKANNVTTEAVANAAVRAWDTFSRAVHGVNARSIVLCSPDISPAAIAMLQALIKFVKVGLEVKAQHLSYQDMEDIEKLKSIVEDILPADTAAPPPAA